MSQHLDPATRVAHPAIGVRPLVDGRRRGVRESLEEQTMALARAAADLISSRLRYPDGEPVRVVVAPTTVGGPREAANTDACFRAAGVCADLTVTASWNYVTEVLDLTPDIPHAMWGFNATERPGAVTVAAAMAAYTQLGIPAFAIYGHDVQEADGSLTDDVCDQILRFARAAVAVGLMRGRSYIAIGTVAMGIAGCRVPEQMLQDYLGLRSQYIDMIEIDRRINQGIYDHDAYQRAIAWVDDNLTIGEDHNPADRQHDEASKREQLEYSVKMVLVARDLMDGNPELARMGFKEEAGGYDAIAAGFQGQRQWTDYKPNGDLMETLLNTGFDWDGPHRPAVFATEGDCLNGMAMLLGNLLTQRPMLFSDVRTYWSPDAVERVTGHRPEGRAAGGFVDLRNSGASTLDACGCETDEHGRPTIKRWWELTDEDIAADLAATTFHAATHEYFPGGGFSTHFTTAGGMPVTAVRMNMVAGVGPTLQVTEGWTVELPEEARDIIVDRTDPTWPTTFFVPRIPSNKAFSSVYDWMDKWGANHTATGWGHFGADVISLAAMLRIPVSMHNIEREDIFRPRTWSSFGTADPESADYRACAALGPLYR